MIVVVGEALIDLIEENDALRPHTGGGPFNTAVALGRLGVPVGFLGRLSNDSFGRLLETQLLESGVDCRYTLRGPAPTPLAIVHETDGDPEFAFYLAGTAYADMAAADLPLLDDNVVAVSAGTLSLATDPPGHAIEAWIERESQRRVIIVDPNIRPAVLGDADAYRRRFEHWASFAHVIKLSDADAAWLFPGQVVEEVIDELLGRGVKLAVATLGREGALAKTAAGRAQVVSPVVDVVDTVGAGDAFGAGLLHWLWVNDHLGTDTIGTLDREALACGLGFAATVGALQCSYAGASPPTLREVDAFLADASRPPRDEPIAKLRV